VEMEEGLGWLGGGIHHNLMQDRAQEALFERLRRCPMMPDGTQILAQAAPPLALLGTDRHLTTLERCPRRCDGFTPCERLVPATVQRTGPQAMGRSGPVILPPGSVALVARLLQGACQGLPLGSVIGLHTLQSIQSRWHASGLERLQDGSDDSLVHPEAAARQP
jgi:hypothetical protein